MKRKSYEMLPKMDKEQREAWRQQREEIAKKQQVLKAARELFESWDDVKVRNNYPADVIAQASELVKLRKEKIRQAQEKPLKDEERHQRDLQRRKIILSVGGAKDVSTDPIRLAQERFTAGVPITTGGENYEKRMRRYLPQFMDEE